MDLPKNNETTYFAETDYRNQKKTFGIKDADRARHVYVIGKTGMGKSTLLENMAIQDIQNGHGMAFIDPHGGTAERLLDYIPESRVKDVIYFAPFDTDYPISFNIMEDVGYEKRHLVVSGLMGVFKKIWVDAWSARMEYILSNTLFALLEYPESTLLGVNRMYTDKDYRKKVADNIKDPSVKSFWVDEFAKYTDRYTQDATPAIQNKIGQFTNNPLVRNIVGQSHSAFDIRKIMDEKKILIMNLSKGRIGDQNASLIGSMLVTKIYLAAMSRADVSNNEIVELPNFYFYVDEFQSFANESFADILSEARKYKLNLTIAHQYIEQMPEEVRSAVFGNVGTMISFRIGAFDAEIFEREFAPEFTKEDMVSLGFAQIYLKLMINGVSSAPFSAVTLPPIEAQAESLRDDVIAYTRATYAKPRAGVEEKIISWHASAKPAPVKLATVKSAAVKFIPATENSTMKTKSAPIEKKEELFSQKTKNDFLRHDQAVHVAAPLSHTPPKTQKNDFSPPSSELKTEYRQGQDKKQYVKREYASNQRSFAPRVNSHTPVVQKKYDNNKDATGDAFRQNISHAPHNAPKETNKPTPVVSLAALAGQNNNAKNKHEDTKTATQEHLSDLRKTLASVMNIHSDKFAKRQVKENTPIVKQSEKEEKESKIVSMAQKIEPKIEKEESKITKKENEIPEQVLRKILDEKL